LVDFSLVSHSRSPLHGRVIFRTHPSGDAILEIERDAVAHHFLPPTAPGSNVVNVDDVMDVVVPQNYFFSLMNG
jgi:hypothetical protein